MNMQRPTSIEPRAAGFTVIEMIIVIVLIGITAGLAAPSLGGVIDRSNTTRVLDRIAGDIAYTRMLAVRDGNSMAVCLDSQTRYSLRRGRDCSGEIVRTVDLARRHPGLRVEAPGAPACADGMPCLSFNSRGLRHNATQGTVRVSRGSQSHQLTISGIGRVQRDY